MGLEEALRILELHPHATVAEAERAYRRLAMLWHPDRNSSEHATHKMASLNQAIQYVRELRDDNRHGSSYQEPPPNRAHESPFEAYWRARGFDDIFGRRRHDPPEYEDRTPPHRARDIRRKLKLTLLEAAFGTVKTLKGTISDACHTCHGERFTTVHCDSCDGSGVRRSRSPSWDHYCKDCGGQGARTWPCKSCKGSGKEPARNWEVQITVPAGTLPDTVLRARGHGSRSAPGGNHGDLIASVEIQPHPFFAFDEDKSLTVRVPVSAFRWISGGPIVVPTLFGFTHATLSPGQTEVVLPQEGWPHRAAPRGSLTVHVQPVYPDAISESQQQLLAQLEKQAHLPELRAWDEQMLNWANPSSREGAQKRRT